MAGKVSLANTDDIPDLLDIFWEAFSGPGEIVFPHTDDGRKWLQRSFENFLGQKSYYRPETKVAVVRNISSASAVLSHIWGAKCSDDRFRQTGCTRNHPRRSTRPEYLGTSVEDAMDTVRGYPRHERRAACGFLRAFSESPIPRRREGRPRV